MLKIGPQKRRRGPWCGEGSESDAWVRLPADDGPRHVGRDRRSSRPPELRTTGWKCRPRKVKNDCFRLVRRRLASGAVPARAPVGALRMLTPGGSTHGDGAAPKIIGPGVFSGTPLSRAAPVQWVTKVYNKTPCAFCRSHPLQSPSIPVTSHRRRNRARPNCKPSGHAKTLPWNCCDRSPWWWLGLCLVFPGHSAQRGRSSRWVVPSTEGAMTARPVFLDRTGARLSTCGREALPHHIRAARLAGWWALVASPKRSARGALLGRPARRPPRGPRGVQRQTAACSPAIDLDTDPRQLAAA